MCSHHGIGNKFYYTDNICFMYSYILLNPNANLNPNSFMRKVKKHGAIIEACPSACKLGEVITTGMALLSE